MALIKCPECGKEFSDKAAACPNCGFPTSELTSPGLSEDESSQDSCESTTDSFFTKTIGSIQAGIQDSLERSKDAPKTTKQIGPIQIDENRHLFRINGSVVSNGKKDGFGMSMFKGMMAVSTLGMSIAAEKMIGGNKQKVGTKEYSSFSEDFITLNPYMGSDSILPFVKVCKEEKKGVFVLVKTSNPSSGEFQDRIIDGRPLYEWVGEKVNEWGSDFMGDEYSYVGAVVGATYPEMARVLRNVMPKAFILVPGYGAQGGAGKDLKDFFNQDGLGAIVNSSRGIIAAYKQEKYAKFGAENFAEASRQAVLDMKEDLEQAWVK